MIDNKCVSRSTTPGDDQDEDDFLHDARRRGDVRDGGMRGECAAQVPRGFRSERPGSPSDGDRSGCPDGGARGSSDAGGTEASAPERDRAGGGGAQRYDHAGQRRLDLPGRPRRHADVLCVWRVRRLLERQHVADLPPQRRGDVPDDGGPDRDEAEGRPARRTEDRDQQRPGCQLHDLGALAGTKVMEPKSRDSPARCAHSNCASSPGASPPTFGNTLFPLLFRWKKTGLK